MSRRQIVKNKNDPIADGIEQVFDAAHGVVDKLLWPLKPVDSVIHGTARGVKNWLCDEHPSNTKTTTKKQTIKKKPAVIESGSDDDSDGSEPEPPPPPPQRNTGGCWPTVGNSCTNYRRTGGCWPNRESLDGKVNF